MKRSFVALFALGCAAAAAQAHFVYIVPGEGTGAKVIFSDSLEPDEAVAIEKIAQTKLFVRDAAGKVAPLPMTKGQNAYTIMLPSAGPATVGGSCTYGVFQRGDSKPTLLHYHPKLIVGPVAAGKAWDKLPMEILPTAANQFVVLFRGKPVPSAELSVLLPGDKTQKLTADARGEFTLDTRPAGAYALWARHGEMSSGEHDGKKYEEVRHYATLVFRSGAQAKLELTPARVTAVAAVVDTPGADAEATRLLADARAARATWASFPGFTADIEVNQDGKVSRGKVKVDADGNVSLEGLEKLSESWAKRVLGSIVAHRLPASRGTPTPCAFGDDQKDHPLGRLVKVLNDELHSSYRIKDRQIMVVNREMGEGRFSIVVQENHTTPNGKFVPTSFVVSSWDKEGNLTRAESTHQTWTRVGELDLSATA